MTKLLRILAVASALLAAPVANAQQLLADIFQDHAVLQRDRPIQLWGKDPRHDGGVVVTVDGHAYTTEKDGRYSWRVTLPAMPAGGPHTITVTTASGFTQTISDVLVGDVWLCSGQSNMEFDVAHGLNSGGEIGTANDPEMRLLTVGKDTAKQPEAAFKTPVRWQAVTPETVGDFSAACYFMARDLRQSEKVPFGLIDASWGGTPIDAWRTGDALTGDPAMQDRLALLAIYRSDMVRGNRLWGDIWTNWWRSWSHDAPGKEPWQANPPGEWQPVPALTNWEGWGIPALANYNGYVWYRTEVTVSAAQAGMFAKLGFGPVDDTDMTFVNGIAVGTTTSWNQPRDYPVAPGTLHAGSNRIAIAALDTGGGGGLSGTAAQRAIRFEDGSVVPLPEAAQWRYRVVPGPADPPHAPWENTVEFASIYNGMVAPLGRYGLRGVAWYQGEADAGTPRGYAGKLASMMRDWRDQFGNRDLPFLIVQLAGYGPRNFEPGESGFASIREEQRKAVAADPHAALIVAFDLGEVNDIHPTNKQDVGHRLARAARARAYGGKDSPSGPWAVAVTRQGSGVAVGFDAVEGGLVAYSAFQPIGFELCGAAIGSCRFVTGRIEGNRVVLEAGRGPIDRVRFCWGDSPLCNLYDRSGLPAGPFELAVH
ncbi:MAG: sialate O-acetylesterase [Pseudomonadota bacterium]